MGLSFLTPLFALGFAAIAIPILVHLVHKERKETTPFPSLTFLRRVPYRHSSRRKLRDLLLFLLRAAAVVFAVAAFSRPVIARARSARAASGGGREVVVLLDRSFSMRYSDRWRRATAAVQQRIDVLGSDDRLTIVPFDLTARAINDPTADHGQLRLALDSLRPVDGGTRYAPAMAVARRLLSVSRLPRREVVVVTDFQRSAFDLNEESRLPAGVEVTPIDVVTGDVQNRGVRNVELRRVVTAGRELLSVHARVANVGPAARAVAVTLGIAGREVESKNVDLPANGGATVDFSPIPVPPQSQAASVAVAADALPGDDAYNFVFSRTPVVNVLLVNSPELIEERDIFLRRALEIGDRPPFDVRVRTSNTTTPADLAAARVVVLNDAWLSDALTSRLTQRVREGAGLLVATGQHLEVRPRAGADALLAGPIAAAVDREGARGGVLGYLDASHPALAIFAASRSGDLSAARFLRYRPITAASGVLARFDDGAGALAERHVGRGRVLQLGTSLDGYWNDLPRQPVFLPFLHQLMRYAADFRERRDAYVVGEAVDNASQSDSAPNARVRQPLVADAPSGERVRFGGAGEPATLVPQEAGVYAIRPVGAPGSRPRLVAVNIDPRELDFGRFDPTRLSEAVRSADSVTTAAADSSTVTLKDQEREQSIWWYILAGLMATVVVEALLARRVTAGRPSVS